MLTSLVIDSKLDLVGLVNVEIMLLVGEAVVSCRLRATFEVVLYLHDHKRLWSTRKAASRRMIDIGNSVDAYHQVATQRFPLTGHIEAVICMQSVPPVNGVPVAHILTILHVRAHVNVKILMSLQCLFQQDHLLVALDPSSFRLSLASPIALELV